MAHTSRLVPALALCSLSLLAAPLHAQKDIPLDPRAVGGVPLDSTGAPIEEDAPQLAFGLSGGSIRYHGGRAEQGVSALIQMAPTSWLSLTAAPGYGHTTYGTSTTSGVTEVPLTAKVLFGLGDLPWTPIFSASASTVMSLNDKMNSIGVGSQSMDAGLGVLAWPLERLAISASGFHSINKGTGNPSAQFEVAIPFEPFITRFGYTSEFGTPDTGTELARSLTGGLAISVGGPFTLTMDGSHGMTTGAPDWSLAVGFGTAFSGISPLNSSSAIGRLRQIFGRRMLSTSGYVKDVPSCKTSGTC